MVLSMTLGVMYTYNGVTMVLQWCHNGVIHDSRVDIHLPCFHHSVTMVVVQWFYSGVTMVLLMTLGVMYTYDDVSMVV
jgi:hypothetical protein